MEARYPRQVELSRLEVMGDPPFLDLAEAERDYREARGLHVFSARDSASGKPCWFLSVRPGGARFVLRFYSDAGSIVREATWESVSTELRCVETVDLFYAEGDPGRIVPWEDVINVTRNFSRGGVLKVTFAPPGRVSGADKPKKRKKQHLLPSFAEGPEGRNGRVHTVRDVPQPRVATPAFGDWERLLEASAPADLARFGDGAAEAAEDYADTVPATTEKEA